MEENAIMETTAGETTQPQAESQADVDTSDTQTSVEETAEGEQTSEPEAQEAAEPEENEKNEKTEKTEEENQTFTVKYNGEEKQLTREEMISLAQKGMNYDKVNGQLEQFKNNRAMQDSYAIIEHYAKANGMEVADYLAELNAQREQAENQRFAEENNIPVEQAANVRKMQEEANAILERQRFTDEMMELFTDYPDLKAEDITDDVLAFKNQHNVPLKIAYQMTAGLKKLEAEKAQLEQKLKIKEEAAKNSGLSTGSTKGVGAENTDFTNIKNMSLEDYAKKSDAIWANLKRRI